ncbi:MAG: extracellular solute-binding protein [Alphaproteobacteria bacterium]
MYRFFQIWLWRATILVIITLIFFPATSYGQYRFQHGFSLWGKLAYGKNFSYFHYLNPNAPKGGKLVLSELGGFDSFNPFLIQGIVPGSIGLIYDTLMTASDDEVFSVYGLIADGIYVSPDKRTIAFHINPKARFQDGKPITADDVVWTFQTLLATNNPSFKSYYRDVKKVHSEGRAVVVFTNKNPANRELPSILAQLAILPKHFWQGKDFNQPSLHIPLGSGAYRIKEFSPSKFVVYELIENYWAKNLNSQRGKNNFSTLKYQFYRDSTVQFEAFKAEQFDLRIESIARAWATGYDVPAIKNKQMLKREFRHKRIAPLQVIQFNLRRPLFADTDGRVLRRALQYLWDFQWANENLMYNAYTRTASIFDNSILRARGLPSKAELKLLEPFRDELPKEVFGPAYIPPKNNGDNNRANMITAVKLLEANGFYYKGQVLYSPKNIPVEFTILLDSSLFIPLLSPFVQAVRRVGGKVNLRVVDSSVLTRQLLNFNYDVILVARGNSESPGNEQLALWGSQSANQMGSANLGGVRSEVLDALINKLIKVVTYDDLTTIARAMDRVIMWQYYFIPMYYLNYDRVAYWNKITCPKASDRGFTLLTCWANKNQ